MAVRVREPRLQRTAKWFRRILEEKIASLSTKAKRSEVQKVSINLEICAHPRILDQIMEQSDLFHTFVDKYEVSLNPMRGNDWNGRLSIKDVTMTIFVYDVSDAESLEYLQTRLLPNTGQVRKSMAIVGIGLEKRNLDTALITPIDTCWHLAYQHGCPGSEVIFCDPTQMTAGIFGLYMQNRPEEFKIPQGQKEEVDLEGDIEKDQGDNDSAGKKKRKPKSKGLKKKKLDS